MDSSQLGSIVIYEASSCEIDLISCSALHVVVIHAVIRRLLVCLTMACLHIEIVLILVPQIAILGPLTSNGRGIFNVHGHLKDFLLYLRFKLIASAYSCRAPSNH
jgi:hypothetical protein